MTKEIVIGLAATTLATAVIGAFYWWRSSRVNAVPSWSQMGTAEPGDLTLTQMGWLAASIEAALKTAALNKVAAIWTGVSAIFGALTTIGSLSVGP